MPEDRNAGVRSPGALAAPPFIPKTTYRRIKRCFSFRKGRSVLSLCSALLVKPGLGEVMGAACAGRWEHRNKRHETMQMLTFHEWFIYFFVHLFVVGQLILSPLHNNPWMMGCLKEVAWDKIIAELLSKNHWEELGNWTWDANCCLFGWQNTGEKSLGFYLVCVGGKKRGSKGTW